MMIVRVSRTDFWLTVSERYGRVGGRVLWEENAAPSFVKFHRGWPLVTLELVRQRQRSSIQTGIQARPSSWHAHLPRRLLGIPAQFRISALESRARGYQDGTLYVFDFTGMAPLPADDLERKAIILLEEIESLRQNHPEILARLGIEVIIHFHDD